MNMIFSAILFFTLDLQKPNLSNSLAKLNLIVCSDAPKLIFYRNTETELKVFISLKKKLKQCLFNNQLINQIYFSICNAKNVTFK